MGKYDVTKKQGIVASQPTSVQARVVDDIINGAKLIGKFDVYGGYEWFLKRQNGMVSKVSIATVQGLLDRGLIIKGKSVSIYSGCRETPFTLR